MAFIKSKCVVREYTKVREKQQQQKSSLLQFVFMLPVPHTHTRQIKKTPCCLFRENKYDYNFKMTQNHSRSALQTRREAGQRDCPNAFGEEAASSERIIVFCRSEVSCPIETTTPWRAECTGERQIPTFSQKQINNWTHEGLISPFQDGDKMSLTWHLWSTKKYIIRMCTLGRRI